jgi:beta-phosphoglucomutase
MKIRGIAFDLEGTVIDVEKAHHEGHVAAAAEVGVNITLDEAFKKLPHFIGGPDEAICEEIWQLSDKSKPLAFIIERDVFHYHRLLKELPIVPRTGFLDFLKHVRERGLKTAIGSLTERVEAAVLLERSGLDKFFDRKSTVLREDVKELKPAPDVFVETARRMGISPSEQLVFEDSPRGIQAALKAGSLAIGMPVYKHRAAINSLKEAGALHIYQGWGEIDIIALLSQLGERSNKP